MTNIRKIAISYRSTDIESQKIDEKSVIFQARYIFCLPTASTPLKIIGHTCEWITALKDRAQTHSSTNEALGWLDRIRSSHRNSSHPRNVVQCHRFRSTNTRIDLTQDFARTWRALILSSGNATSKCTQKNNQ